MSRTRLELTEELHALNALLTQPEILVHDKDRDDLVVIERIRAQINVIEKRMSYNELLDEYEDSEEKGSEDVLGAAYDAFRWLAEDDVSPSSRWQETLDDLALVSPRVELELVTSSTAAL